VIKDFSVIKDLGVIMPFGVIKGFGRPATPLTSANRRQDAR